MMSSVSAQEETIVIVSEDDSNKATMEGEKTDKPKLMWMLKPCSAYKEEYSECKSFKARFHQYFLNGEIKDCAQWKQDYDNCNKWEDNEDLVALNQVIDSEKSRVRSRLMGHYANDVWESRKEPPRDWNSPLPSDIQKGYESSFLKLKSDDLKAGKDTLGDVDQNIKDDSNLIFDSEGASMCVIM